MRVCSGDADALSCGDLGGDANLRNDASRELLSSVGQLPAKLACPKPSNNQVRSTTWHVVHAQAATLGFQDGFCFGSGIPYWYMAGMDARPARQE